MSVAKGQTIRRRTVAACANCGTVRPLTGAGQCYRCLRAVWQAARAASVGHAATMTTCPCPCPPPCGGCLASGHHWIEDDRDDVRSGYTCRNCGTHATCEAVWAEEERGG